MEVRVRNVPWLCLLAACWKLEVSSLAEGDVALTPAAAEITSWSVRELRLPLQCPDGKAAAVYVAYPDDAIDPVPVAVIYHSGAFDYVTDPDFADPLVGRHHAPTSRLERDWAVRRVFSTLGMYPSDDEAEQDDGALVAAFTEAGVAMVLPCNCWGDLWHNQEGLADNALADGFVRNGRAAAEWGWQLATDPDYGPQYGLELPVAFTDEVYLAGLGEGARPVGELLDRGARPTSILVDSPVDDLRVYYNNPDLFAGQVAGLDRIFPGGAATTVDGSLMDTSWYPDRSVFVYSSGDATTPTTANAGILGRLDGLPEAWVFDAGVQAHVVTAGDLNVARQAIAWLTNAN